MDQRIGLRIDAIGNFSNVIGEVNKFKAQLQGLKLPDKITAKLEKGFDNVESKVTHFQSLLNKGITTKGDFSKLVSSARAADKALVDLKDDVKAIGDKDIQIAVVNSAEIQKAEKELNKIINAGEKLKNFGTSKGTGIISESEVAKIQKLANTSKGLKSKFQDVTSAFKTGDIDQANTAIESLIAHVKRYQQVMDSNKTTPGKGTAILTWANEVKGSLNGMVSEVEKARASFNQLQSNKFDQMKNSVNGITTGLSNATNGVRQFINAETEAASRTNQLNEQVSNLRTQANYFFGLQNMGRLIASGIREAAESVRDLDKAMTETAVVTDYSVGDMWDMLPEYTKLANKLGATTQGAYETMTLYFQQGLNKQETFEIGEETMKMARIAGLDYAQTTNMMTAALRGFNMELNQTSAKRVNDVYSELAAITASDTRELGLAMERTASIAHSANMDFGNTTAFLAQMIETTREAPENLGTAMKTIIARFQELKANPYEISEVEGEEVDFNRVDKALKSIGVDLMDNRDKFRDLDDVFLDISSKWEGLSQTQQRYIATIAAGARQQSRFLAMVQNYDRLKELTDAAANSEGASQVQFNKTLESYEAKVNRLKNAWQAFTMSLANNKAVKGGVDILQKIITFGNKIIEIFGKAGKAIGGDFGKGIGEMIAAFGLGAAGFKGLQFGANTGLGILARMTTGNKAGGKFFMGNTGGSRTSGAEAGMLTSKITNPIVNAINNLATALGKGKVAVTEQGVRTNEIRQRQNNLYGMLTEERLNTKGKTFATPSLFSPQDVKKQLDGLSKEEQLIVRKNTPIISNALKNSFKNATNKLNLSKEAQTAANKYFKDINTAVSKGQITYAQSLRKAFNPVSMGESIGGPIGEEIIKKAAEASGKYNNSKYTEKFRRQALAKGLTSNSDIENFINKKRALSASKDPNSNVMGSSKPIVAVSGIEAKMTGIAKAATGAGQAVTGLGMALSSAGFTGAGTILMTVGNGLTGIGMAASGASVALNKMGVALKAIKMNPAILLNPIGLAIAGLTALTAVSAIAIKKHNDNIKKMQKESKKVLSDYENGIAKTTRNISKLTEYKDTYQELSLGVDSNNNNINLGTAEYEDYLQIINDIAKMHPEMVKGYNAHGQAILKETDAVNKAIEAEKKQQQTLEDNFTKSDNLDKLILGRNATKRWQVGQDGPKSTNGYIDTTKQSKLKTDSQAVVDAIQKLEGGDQLLANLAEQFGIQASDFTNLSDAGIKVIQEHGANMLEQVQSQFSDATDKTTQGLVKNVQNSIAQVGKDTEGIEEVVEPIYKSLSTYASKEGYFDNIPDEFREAAEKGIKEVAKLTTGEDGMTITGKEMQQRVRQVAQEIENLNGHSGDYAEILASMDEAQAQFVKDLDTEAYGTAIADEIEELSSWRDQALDIYESTGNESQRLIAESLQNQIEAYENFTSEGTKTLADGLNEQSAQLEKAANASEKFKKKTEGINDYYTGAENMKSILDEIKDGVDDVGKGSRTFWAGAEELLGEKYIKNNNFDKVNKQLEKVKGLFYDAGGEALNAKDSADQFLTYLLDHQTDDIKGNLSGQFKEIGEVLNVTDGKFNFEKARGLSAEQFSDLADSLGMSDQLLASMLNKAAQFYNIDFSNVDVLREALVTGGASIAGTQEINGNTALYTKKSSFETEAMAEGYTPPELDNLEKQLKNKGVKLLSDASDMGLNELKGAVKDMGIQSGQEFIKNFSDLGYGKDEVQSLYDKFLGSDKVDQALKDKIGLGDKTFGEAYNEMLDERGWEEDKSAEESTADSTAQIASTSSAILAALGGLNVNEYDKGAEGKEGLGHQALQKVIGGKGQDTLAQGFATGVDYKSGNTLTEQQYQETYNKLLNMQKDYNDKAALLRLQAQHTEDTEEAARFQRQADWYQEAADYTEKYIKQGEEAHQKKMQQNEEEAESNKQKTDSEKEGQQQLSETYKSYLASLNDMDTGQGGQQLLTPDQLAAKYGLSDADIADYKKRYQSLQQQLASNPYADMGLSQGQGDLLGIKKALTDGQTDLTAFKNIFSQVTSALGPNLQLTKEQLGQIKQNISGLDAKQLNNLNTQQLLADLKLDNKQIAALEAANIDIPVETSDEDLEGTKKKKEDLEKPVEIPVNTKNNFSPDNNKDKLTPPKSATEAQEVTKDLKVTYVTTISNEGEITAYLDSRISSIVKNAKANKNLNLRASITVDYKKGKQAKADKKSTTVDYKKGKQEDAADKKAKVNYVRGTQEDPKSPKTAKVNYDLGTQANPKDKHAKVIYDEAAKGKNNKIVHQSLPTFNSLAVGNVKKQPKKPASLGNGLTLTGEKGFEIAWLPSENRSMILGASGPQMVNLPKDAVVWTNEQSKKILKQKAIPAASMVGGNGSWGGSSKTSKKTTTKTSTKRATKTHKNNNTTKRNNRATTRNINETKKILQKAGKVSAWWWNMTKKVEATQRNIDRLAKELEKSFKKVGMTRTNEKLNTTIEDYRKYLKKQINLNTTMEKQAKKQLNTLNKGKASKATIKAQKQVKKDEKRLAKARKTKSKKDDKAAKKQLAKDRKRLNNTKKGINWANISYEVTERKKKKGKVTKSKKKKSSRINLAPFISFDTATGAYIVDYKKINQKYGSNKSKAQAVLDAAEKRIEDYTNKRNTATDKITKSREALEQLNNDIYETFYRWEKSITEIYLLSQKLEEISKKLAIASSQADLQFAKLEAGVIKSADALPQIQKALTLERENLLAQARGKTQNLYETQTEFKNSLDLSTYLDKYLKNPNSSEAIDDYAAAKLAFDFLEKQVNFTGQNFDYSKAIQTLESKKYNEETYNQIKSVLDKIFEKQGAYLDAANEAYEAQKEIYEKMEEYQSFISEFEQDLLSGIEEQAENEIDRLDKLNSSLSKAFKDLLDEVKRKLDERRKQEDNAKTESDIAKKQQRLAALRADTAGGHQVEIAQLEKEIADAQQNYQRSLEDQLLDRLQQQGDEAERQRQRQIDLLETQKEIAKQTGTNLEEVKKWLEDYEGNYDLIRNAWLANEGYDEATPSERTQLEQQFEEEWSKFLTYRVSLGEYENMTAGPLKDTSNNADATSESLKSVADNTDASKLSLANLEESVNTIVDHLVDIKVDTSAQTNKQLHDEKVPIASFAKYIEATTGKVGAGAVKLALEAGYKEKEVAKQYGSSAALRGGISGKTAQAANKTSAKALQKIVNKDKNDEATQKDLAGVKVGKIDINGKKKGGIVKDSHLSSGGGTVGANAGSTLYTKDWIEKTGKVASGAWKKTPISQLTVALLKQYPKDAKDALISAIQNQKVGSKINKNFKDLVNAAGIVGKTYKLKNGIQGSIGGDGTIHYNNGTEGVKIWNPSSGKLTSRTFKKYGAEKFKEWAKNSNVGREYSQVNEARKKKKLSHYAQGGLANFTGPAWLDGTPTKPELVLNSTDTKNFIALRDVLSNAIGSANSVSNNYGGDMNYEININVDHLNNDYDVDKVANRVKQIIVKDARYRNVTQVRNLR